MKYKEISLEQLGKLAEVEENFKVAVRQRKPASVLRFLKEAALLEVLAITHPEELEKKLEKLYPGQPC